MLNSIDQLDGARRRAAHARGDYATALRLGKDNIAERTAVFGADNFRVAVDYHNVAMTLQLLGRYHEAETALQQARSLLAKDLSKPTARLAALDESLCLIQMERGQLQAALTLCARAIAQSERALGAEHPQTLRERNALAGVFLAGGDLAATAPVGGRPGSGAGELADAGRLRRRRRRCRAWRLGFGPCWKTQPRHRRTVRMPRACSTSGCA